MKPEAAQRQMEAEQAAAPLPSPRPLEGGPYPRGEVLREGDGHGAPGLQPTPGTGTVTRERKARRFYGSVDLDPLRASRDAATLVDEILRHLAALPDAEIRVTLEIQAHIPDGAPEHVVRTVTENARTLKFNNYGFEEE